MAEAADKGYATRGGLDREESEGNGESGEIGREVIERSGWETAIIKTLARCLWIMRENVGSHMWIA